MLRERLASAALLVPPLLLVLLLGQPWLTAAVALLVVLAAIETFRLLRAAGYPTLAGLGTVLGLGIGLEIAGLGGLDGTGFLLGGIGLVLAAVGAFPRTDPRDGLATWAATVLGAVYVAQLGFVVRLGSVAPDVPPGAALAGLGAERGWILLLVLAIWTFDSAAYLVGRRFGRRRFLSHLSPSKTYAGLAGGLVAATAVVALGLAALGQPATGALVLGPLVGLSAQAGDLAESMLKRAAGAKDSGRLIPGHGGILDRVDSFLFAAPAAPLYVVAVVR